MIATGYDTYIADVKHQVRTARHCRTRVLAYHIELGYHGHATMVVTGIYRWYPSPGHVGWLVEADALVLDIAID